MLFVALGKVRAGTSKERIARRLQWSYPQMEGTRAIGEYWLQISDPQVISIMETDSIAPIMAATSEWDDVLEWTVVPAVTAEQGMEIAAKMAQR